MGSNPAEVKRSFPPGVLGYLLGGYVPPRSQSFDLLRFRKNFAFKMIPCSRNRPIFNIPFKKFNKF